MAAESSFSTFYEYFLYTKTWAYGLMFVTLPAFTIFWYCILFPCKKGECDKDNHGH